MERAKGIEPTSQAWKTRLEKPILRLDGEGHFQPGVVSLKFSKLIMEACWVQLGRHRLRASSAYKLYFPVTNFIFLPHLDRILCGMMCGILFTVFQTVPPCFTEWSQKG